MEYSSQLHKPITPRSSKKRSRASRRPPTTVLATDISNFRAMVQEFTGVPSPPPFSPTSLSTYHLLRPFPPKLTSLSSSPNTTSNSLQPIPTSSSSSSSSSSSLWANWASHGQGNELLGLVGGGLRRPGGDPTQLGQVVASSKMIN